MSTARTILHLDLDSFFVSVERLLHPELNNRPLLIGGNSDRGVVASCSYEARRFGIHSAMPMKRALQLCPHATVISGDMELYSRHSRLITDIIQDRSPLYEKASIDEFYVDLTGMDRFFGCYKWSRELRQFILKESGLPVSFGLSVNKMVSKVATGEAKPNGERHVETGQEQLFLGPLSVRKLPMVGQKTYQLLHLRGVEKVETLRQIPPHFLESLLGKHGRTLWKRAHGIDESPVEPYSEAKSMSKEQTFMQDTVDVHRIRQILTGMTEQLAWKLRKSDKLTSCVTVKIRYSNFDTETKQRQVPYTASDHVLIRHVQELFGQLFQRRMLIRLVGVRLSGLVQGGHQMNLFDDVPEQLSLYRAMDAIRQKYGKEKVMRACGLKG